MRRERLRGVLVERLLVLVAVRVDVEGDLLDLAREPERRLVRVAPVDDQAVVAADVHARVSGEAGRYGVLHPTRGDRVSVDEQRHPLPVAGLGSSAAKTISTVTSPSGSGASDSWVYSSTPSIE